MTLPRVLACYSSQSGTSENLAERFCNDINEKTQIEDLCVVCNIGKFESENELKELDNYDLVVFFISSYGEGEPCDDAVKFFTNFYTHKSTLQFKNYSIFGCGNSYYDKYQAVAIELKESLDTLGKIQVGEFGQSNEANNSVLDDFDAWEFDYLPVISKFLNVEMIEVSTYHPMYDFVKVYKHIENAVTRPPYQELKPFVTDIDLSSVKKYGSRYIHFNINLHKDQSKLKYQSGDHVGIYPMNNTSDVNDMLELLNISEEFPFKVVSMNRMVSNRWVNKTFKSYADYLTSEIEINGVLSRKLIKDLIRYFIYKSSVDIRNKLNELIKSNEMFREKVIDKKLTLVKLFGELQIKKGEHYDGIPLSFIVEYFGLLKPRFFSISSSGVIEPDNVSVLIKLVKDDANRFEGICSNTVERIITGASENRVPIFLNKSKFKLPMDLSRPMVFVGAGSGIAPFRGFLQEICGQASKLKSVSKIVVYFGVHELSDEYYIYKESMAAFQQILGDRLVIRMAVSTGETREYVQDAIRRDSEAIAETLVDKNGHVFVCGDAGGMSQGVKKVLVDVLGGALGGNVKSGDRYVQYLQSMGRYREDVW